MLSWEGAEHTKDMFSIHSWTSSKLLLLVMSYMSTAPCTKCDTYWNSFSATYTVLLLVRYDVICTSPPLPPPIYCAWQWLCLLQSMWWCALLALVGNTTKWRGQVEGAKGYTHLQFYRTECVLRVVTRTSVPFNDAWIIIFMLQNKKLDWQMTWN